MMAQKDGKGFFDYIDNDGFFVDYIVHIISIIDIVYMI